MISNEIAAFTEVVRHLPNADARFFVWWQTHYAAGVIDFIGGSVNLLVDRWCGHTIKEWEERWQATSDGEDFDFAEFVEFQQQEDMKEMEDASDWPQCERVVSFEFADPACFEKLATKLAEYGVNWQE